MTNAQDAAARKATQLFRKEDKEREGQAAWKEYTAQQAATQEKTNRLRALRLARKASAAPAAATTKPRKKTAAKGA
jgi:hypothetical protein